MSRWAERNQHDSKIYIQGYNDGYETCEIEIGKYSWHDLRKNPNDLPIYEKPYWCVIETMGKTLYDSKIKREYTVLGRYQILNLKEFVIAWREIDRFEEVTE